MTTKTTDVQRIVDEISSDLERMRDGNNPQFDLFQLGARLHAAQRLTAESEHAGLGHLTADEEAAAAALLDYATETLSRMSRHEVRQLIFAKQQAADRVWLRLVAMISRDRELIALAERPLIDLRPALSEARAVAARWRELARLTPEQRRASADLRARIEASRNTPPPASVTDARQFGDLYRMSGL